MDVERCEAGALERAFSDVRDARREAQGTSESAAGFECAAWNGRQSARQRKRREAGSLECYVSNGRHALKRQMAAQAAGTVERPVTYVQDTCHETTGMAARPVR